MRTAEILQINRSRQSLLPSEHVAVLVLSGPDWVRFRSFFESADQGVVILDAQADGLDRIVVRAGCSTREIQDRLHTGWA